MLNAFADLTAYIGERYDLAAVNFWLSWIAAIGSAWLMLLSLPQRSLRTWRGALMWARTCGLFWLTAALAVGGSYPVEQGMQPWLPTVLVSAAVLLLVKVLLISELIEEHRRSLAVPE